MKRQKLLAMLLAGCMCMLAGCGTSKAEEEQAQEPVWGQEAVSEKVEGQQIPPSGEASSEEADSLAAPQITITPETINRYSDDGEVWLVHVDYDMASVAGEGYEALAEAVNAWSEERMDSILAETEQYTSDAAEYVVMTGEENYRDSYYFNLSSTLEPARVDDKVVSLVETVYAYGGGAHGNYGHEGINFDARTGARLELGDILADAEGFYEAAVSYITEQVSAEYAEGLFPDYAETIADMREQEPDWYLDAAGITFMYDPYELGPYAMGDVQVTLPMAEFADYVKEEYRGLGHKGYAVLPENVDIPVNTPLSSLMKNVLRLNVEHNEEMDMADVSVRLNDSAAGTGMFARIGSAYQINTGMFQYVVLDADYASDDYVTVVYNVSTGSVQETDRLEGTRILPETIRGEQMKLSTRLDVFGTYSGTKSYTLDDKSGKLQTGDLYYEITGNDSPLHALAVSRELPVVIDGEETKLPVGSRIRIIGTDNEGIALFKNVDTGEEGEIHYVRGDGAEDTWMIHVEGVPEQEYFDTYLPYAG